MAQDDKLIITPDEAIALLPEGAFVHNFANPAAGMMVGCDYERDEAIAALRSAPLIEIGGDGCKRVGHALVVHKIGSGYTFFQADKERVSALEAARQAVAA